MMFDGYLTGAAEKHFYKRSRILGQYILILGTILITPGIFHSAIRSNDWSIVAFFAGIFMCVILFTFIPKRKTERKKITPKRIVVTNEYMVCVAEKYTETRLLSDVKMVIDFGAYYEIRFPLGKLSDKFICQKDLIKDGTIHEFEALFVDKITRNGGQGDGSKPLKK